jgi:hypothetical protein
MVPMFQILQVCTMRHLAGQGAPSYAHKEIWSHAYINSLVQGVRPVARGCTTRMSLWTRVRPGMSPWHLERLLNANDFSRSKKTHGLESLQRVMVWLSNTCIQKLMMVTRLLRQY